MASHCKRTLSILLLFLILVPQTIASRWAIETLPGFEGKLPFKLETGYVGVGEDDDVQLFYYFVESERNPRKDPLVFWLTGGPGCSGLSAIIYEMGPITFNYQKYDYGKLPTLLLNPFSWTKLASIIFIDAPVGTGFSYSRNPEWYNVTDTIAAAQNYEFLRKWLWEHPKFMANPLYVSGDSYGGKMTPITVQHILNGIHNHELPVINIQGFFIGNPSTDEEADKNSRVEYVYRVGLLSTELYQWVKESCKGFYYYNVNTSNVKCVDGMKIVTECLSNIDGASILEPNCAEILLQSNKNKSSVRLVAEEYSRDQSLSLPTRTHELWCRIDNYALIYVWANDKDVQEALRVRKGTKLSWARCNQTLLYTQDVSSVVGYQVNLTRSALDVLVYSGDHDMAVPYLSTMRWIELLNLTIKSTWRPWFCDGQIAGFTTKFESFPYYLTYTTIKLASIIFIDAPVGTGFSYSRNPEWYNVTDTIAAAQNYEFLRKWLWEHPKFMANPLYVSGDSYGGKMTPIIVQHILNGIHNHELPLINIQGFFIGNPITDEDADINSRVEYAYRVGLLSTELYQWVKESCKGFYYYNVNTSNVKCVDGMKIVTECLSNIDIASILEPNCPEVLLPSNKNKSSGRLVAEEYSRDQSLSLPTQTPELWCRIDNYALVYVWANDEDVQEALHVRKVMQ